VTAEDRERKRADDAEVATGEQQHRAEVAEARPGWYWWAVMVVTSVLGPSIAIGVARHNQRQSEQAWCEVIRVLDEPLDPKAPPPSARGQRILAGIAHVRDRYDC